MRGCTASVALFAWLIVTPVAAQEAEALPTVDENIDLHEEEARALFRAGSLAFADGRYEEAAASFRRAWELSSQPSLLYNIAVSEERLRNDQAALDAFEAYLEAVPGNPRRAAIERRMGILRRSLQSATATPAPRAPSPEAVDAEPVDAKPGGGGLLWTWVLGGGAVVAGGLAAVFWVRANDAFDEVEGSDCGMARSCTQADLDDSGGPGAVTATNVLVGASVGLAALGVVAFVVESGSDETAVTVGPGSVLLSGSF